MDNRIFVDYFHLGIKEFYEESFCILLVKLQKKIIDACLCKLGKLGLNAQKVTHGVNDFYTPEIESEVDYLTNIDIMMYEKALIRFKMEVNYIRAYFQEENFLCIKIEDVSLIPQNK
jgi:hypothetical protein